LPQQAHDDRFAVEHRDDRHANIHFAVSNPNFDAAILRQPFLRDVEVAENFDTRNDGRLKPFDLRRHRDFLQHAVNPVTNPQLVLKRFEMNIRGAQINGVAQHLIDEANDRSVFGRGVEVGVFGVLILDDLKRRLLAQRVDGVRAHAQSLFHFPLDRFRGREDGLEAQPRHRFESVKPVSREEAAGRYFDASVHPTQRKQLVLEEHPGGEQ